ncbi:hypothetical protein COW64_21655 [bacterium (Candidatus Blackallbacteria) CG18_big_fil_WC_8_21_14_2_50_49_26]|nr:MAG: hypothetical protein COW64_21655 [bacterium (Candidatus Blackallbacteria) CG18_big_fil_WC_8_21_14_2_50_49_26]
MATPIGRPVSPTYIPASPPEARVAPPASSEPASETRKPVQTQESFGAARQSVVGKSTETVNPSQGGAQLKQGIEHGDGAQLLEQGQSLMESTVIQQEFSDTSSTVSSLPSKSGGTIISSEMLQAQKSKLTPVSQNAVLKLENLDGYWDNTVIRSAQSLRAKKAGSVFDRDCPPGEKGTLNVVGHGAERTNDQGKKEYLIGNKTPQQLVSILKDAGIKTLDTLSLKSCHSTGFMKAVAIELGKADIQVKNIEGFDTRIAIDENSGNILTETNGVNLDQVQGHSGTLDSAHEVIGNINSNNLESASAGLVNLIRSENWGEVATVVHHALQRNLQYNDGDFVVNSVVNRLLQDNRPLQGPTNRYQLACNIATNLISSGDLNQASAITTALGQANQWGLVQNIGEHAIDQNQSAFALELSNRLINEANQIESAMALVDQFATNNNSNGIGTIIGQLTRHGNFREACDAHLTRIQVIAEANDRWDEDYEASFDNIRNNLHAISVNYNFNFQNNRRNDSLDTLFGMSLVQCQLDNQIKKTDYAILKYCFIGGGSKPGSSSMGSLSVNADQIKGRPAFSTDTQAFMPLKSGQHRRHIMAWHNIRDIGSKVLAKGSVEQLQNLIKKAPPNLLAEVSKHLKIEDIRESKDHDELLKGVLFIMNSNPKNLWPGDGRTNSSIANAWSNVNKALNRVGNDRNALERLGQNYAQAGKAADSPYRQAQALAAEVIEAGVRDNVSIDVIKTRVLECIAGLEIDTLGSHKDQTSKIFQNQLEFIDTARVAYRWALNPQEEPAPTLEQLAKFMEYPPGFVLHGVKSQDYNNLQVQQAQIDHSPGQLYEANRSQFQEQNGQTACTAMAMRGISYAFTLGNDHHPQANELNQTLTNGAQIFQQMRLGAQAIGYDMHLFHPVEIPEQAVANAGLVRGQTETIANNDNDIGQRVFDLLSPANVNNQNQLGLSLVLGGATVSITRVNNRFFVYDSHGFQGISQNAFMKEFNDLNDATNLIHHMVQARLGDGRDASITIFRPR